MAPPNTMLLGSPSVNDDPFGTPIISSDMVSGLRKINPDIYSQEQHTWGLWYPGKARGITTLWVASSDGTSRKISAYNYGAIPEFTQIGPHGDIIAKGWRAIFEKVVRCKAASRKAIEKKFRVNLELGDPDTVYCGKCRISGQFVKSENASGLCYMHELTRKDVLRWQQRKAQMRERLRRII